VVHGGETFKGSVLITEKVIRKMEEVAELAPLHNPPNLKGIYAVSELMPHLPQAGIFDTAFHQTMPEYAYMYAIPYSLYKKYGLRRYGFHGTSHRYVSERPVRSWMSILKNRRSSPVIWETEPPSPPLKMGNQSILRWALPLWKE
jgi:acetate kinase